MREVYLQKKSRREMPWKRPDRTLTNAPIPKSRASALSQRHLKWLFTDPSFFSTIQRRKKRDKKTLKLFFDRRTDGWKDGRTDQRTNGLTEKWL